VRESGCCQLWGRCAEGLTAVGSSVGAAVGEAVGSSVGDCTSEGRTLVTGVMSIGGEEATYGSGLVGGRGGGRSSGLLRRGLGRVLQQGEVAQTVGAV
jgi:hypothetical protein